MATPQLTGSITTKDDRRDLVLVRRFNAPAAEIWADMTDSALLERWIGRWEGHPSTGKVDFFMTAESPDAKAEEYTITRCDAPYHFAGNSHMGDAVWHLYFDLEEADGVTTLSFGHLLNPSDNPADVGPGWEYYLDRLTAVREGRAAESVVWDDYYPYLSSFYGADGA